MIRGQCLCGQVKFEINSDDLGEMGFCYCTNCRRANGSAFSANAAVPNDCFKLLSGEHVIRGYESSPGVVRSFCSHCGSPVFARTARDSGHTRVRLGTLDQDVKVRVTSHYFVRSKPSWYMIDDDLPQRE
jgi:hypothetical protein